MKIGKLIFRVLFCYFIGLFFIIVSPCVLVPLAIVGFGERIIKERNIKQYFVDLLEFPVLYIEDFVIASFKLKPFSECTQIEQAHKFKNNCVDQKFNWKQIGF